MQEVRLAWQQEAEDQAGDKIELCCPHIVEPPHTPLSIVQNSPITDRIPDRSGLMRRRLSVAMNGRRQGWCIHAHFRSRSAFLLLKPHKTKGGGTAW